MKFLSSGRPEPSNRICVILSGLVGFSVTGQSRKQVPGEPSAAPNCVNIGERCCDAQDMLLSECDGFAQHAIEPSLFCCNSSKPRARTPEGLSARESRSLERGPIQSGRVVLQGSLSAAIRRDSSEGW
jgi:hypothetical protein